eukprot:gene17704-23295_t
MKRNCLLLIRRNHTTFHKRPLPESLIALSSKKGKELFKEALDQGGLESYFPLSEQFITQSEPSFCSISSLAMVLNALNYDPKKVWKGSWRWVSEEMLQCESANVCGHSLDKIRSDGMNFSEFETLGLCHGVEIQSFKLLNNNDITLQEFRSFVLSSSTSSTADTFIISNFSRKSLGQTGDGHYSPIGGYHVSKDLVLILDVARFKYPPYWVPLIDLWNSMAITDTQTGSPRGPDEFDPSPRIPATFSSREI